MKIVILCLIGAVMSQLYSGLVLNPSSFTCDFEEYYNEEAESYGIVRGQIDYSKSYGYRNIIYDNKESEIYNPYEKTLYQFSPTLECFVSPANFFELPTINDKQSPCGDNCVNITHGESSNYVIYRNLLLSEIKFGSRIFYLSNCRAFEAKIDALRAKLALCPEKVCQLKADMIIDVDGSGSVGKTNFATLKTELRNIIDTLEFVGDNLKVEMHQYSYWNKLTTEFYFSSNKTQVKNKIRDMTYQKGSTATAEVLMTSYNRFKDTGREGYVKVHILITDGKQNQCGTLCVKAGFTDRECGIDDNNEQNSTLCYPCYSGAIDLLHTLPMYMPVAVGIGKDGINEDDLNLFLKQYKNTNKFIGEWAQLKTLFRGMIDDVCENLMTGIPCTNECKGFCGAGGVCKCTDECVYRGNKCGVAECESNQTGYCKPKTDVCVNSDCYNAQCIDGKCYYSEDVCAQRYPAKCVQSAKCLTDNKQDVNAMCEVTTSCQTDKCSTAKCETTNKNAVCEFTPVICADEDRTTIDFCDPDKGCDKSPCREAGNDEILIMNHTYTNGVYDYEEDITGAGCLYTKISCPESNGCVKYQYDKEKKKCELTYMKECAAPSERGGKCYYEQCDPSIEDEENNCVEKTYDCNEKCNAANCRVNVSNLCMIEAVCVDDKCEHRFKACPKSNCYNFECNPSTGECEATPKQELVGCTRCTEERGVYDYCDASDGCKPRKCVESICYRDPDPCEPENECQTATCVNNNGNYTCVFDDTCGDEMSFRDNEKDNCYEVKCNKNTKKCFKEEKEGYCMEFETLCRTGSSCDLDTGKCVFVDKSCVNEDKCIIEECNEETGECQLKENRHEGLNGTSEYCSFFLTLDKCGVAMCDGITGSCMIDSVVCEVPEGESECYEWVCNTQTGTCERRLKDGMKDDGCGGCTKYPGDKCNGGYIDTEKGISIGVGVAIGIAALVGIVVVIALLAMALKKSYDYISKSRNAAMGSSINNPIYDDNTTNSFVSPLFEG